MKNILFGLIFLFILIALPLGGVWSTGKPVPAYLEFPPMTRHVRHSPFSWAAFIPVAFLVIMLLALIITTLFRTIPDDRTRPYSLQKFPWWGMAGVLITSVAWLFAWNRFAWFEAMQPYTFFPLWIGYILTMNGLTFRSSGHCLLIDRPLYYLSLFPLSAVFWWFFEYLNRFVQNWHYLGVENFSATEYILHATICFSTVLPAVLATEEYLSTYPRLARPLLHAGTLHIGKTRLAGWGITAIAAISLAGIGIWPDYLFSMLWIAPLLIITSIQAINKKKTIFYPLRKGNWQPVLLPALAALICGFFWEMWNVKSVAHWEYSIPFVQRFHLFEMPILGYAGYLPFGLECKAVANLLRGEQT